MPDQKEILAALNTVMDPELHRSLVELNMVRDLQISPEGAVTFTLTLTVPTCPMRNQMAGDARKVLSELPGVTDVTIHFAAMSDEERRALMGAQMPQMPALSHFNRIKHVVAVVSGKGGVGKSSVTALLAVSLARQGHKVGILDADVTGPSIPKLFGLPAGGLRGGDAGMLPAMTGLGIRVISTNLLIKEADQAVIWRGPMIAGTIQQFWRETLWGRLDYLLVDLPPGTSDPHLAVMQNLPLSGVILVTTPQELAALVVRKAVHMVQELNIPILGIVENMSYFHCPDNGKQYEIFGPSHVEEIARVTGAPISARIPIDPAIAMQSDAGLVEQIEVTDLTALVDQLTAMDTVPQ
jgi:Mrp family chromosome partitioning ATPase